MRNNHNKLNFEAESRKLLSSCMREGLQCATDIRERIVHLPFDALESKYRHTLLEILNRLPNNEVLRPYTTELLRIATETLSHDNEENALTCLRIIFDLHKNFRPALESEVQSFLNLVQQIYASLPEAVRRSFPERNWNQPGDVKLNQVQHQMNNIAVEPSFGADLQTLEDEHGIEASDVTNHMNFSDIPQPPLSLRGSESFRVLTECPLIVMLLFQLYPKYIQDNIPRLTPLMMSALALRAPVSAREVKSERYTELIACQVKTLSFLTYLLRGFSDLMKPYEDAISQAVISLLASCPNNALAIRKELLVATRHILATDFRKGFFSYIDVLLDEDVLVGSGRQCREALRPLAFSTLADLVHHVRPTLTNRQLATVVMLFSRNLHDPGLTISVQTTSVRLVLNLVDFIFHSTDSGNSGGRLLLECILRALISKFDTLRWLVVDCASSRRPSSARNCELFPFHGQLHLLHSTSMFKESACVKYSPKLIPSTTVGYHARDYQASRMSPGSMCKLSSTLQVNDVRNLFQTMLRGLKTVMWCISHYQHDEACFSVESISCQADRDTSMSREASRLNVPNENDRESVSEGHDGRRSNSILLTNDEARSVSQFFEWGIQCCQQYAHVHLLESELKEIMDSFSGTFTVLDGYNLRMTVGLHIPLLFETILQTPPIVSVVQLLLANTNVSSTFADILLDFLIQRLHILAHLRYQSHEMNGMSELAGVCHAPTLANQASVVLKLFKIVFGSVALFDGNETALCGKLHCIVLTCVQYATCVRHPVGFLLLLRALFRSLGSPSNSDGDKMERCYDELEVILPTVIDVMNRLRCRESNSELDVLLLAEVCLLLPARPRVLESYIDRLVPNLVVALSQPGDLAVVSLRILERCIDQLGASRLINSFPERDVDANLIVCSICMHLRPSPYPYGTTALRILGKLGGRNRKFQRPRPSVGLSLLLPTSLERSVPYQCSHVPPTHGFCRRSGDENGCLTLRFSWKRASDVSISRIDSSHEEGPWFPFDTSEVVAATCELFHTLFQTYSDGMHSEDNDLTESLRNAVGRRYLLLCFRVVATLLSCILAANDDLIGSGSMTASTSGCSNELHASSMQVRMLLFAALRASTHVELKVEANKLIDGICLRVASLAKAHQDAIGDVKASQTEAVDSRDVELGGAHVRFSITLHREVHSPANIYVNALVDALKSNCCLVQKAAVDMLCLLADKSSAMDSGDHTGAVDGCSSILSIVSKQLSGSLRNPANIISVCHALAAMLPKLGGKCADLFESDFLPCLMNALELSLRAPHLVHMLVSTLCLVVRQSWLIGRTTSRRVQMFSVQFVLDALWSASPAVRLGMQCLIVELNVAAGMPALSSSVFQNDITTTVLERLYCCMRKDSPSQALVGVLDAMTFLLFMEPAVLCFDEVVLTSVQNLIMRARIGWRSQQRHGNITAHHSLDQLQQTPHFAGGSSEHNLPYVTGLSLFMIHGSVRAAVHPRLWLRTALIRLCYAAIRCETKPSTANKLQQCTTSVEFYKLVIPFAVESLSQANKFECISATSLLQSFSVHATGSVEIDLSRDLDLHASDGKLSLTTLLGIERVCRLPGVCYCMGYAVMETVSSWISVWQDANVSELPRGYTRSVHVYVGVVLLQLLTHLSLESRRPRWWREALRKNRKPETLDAIATACDSTRQIADMCTKMIAAILYLETHFCEPSNSHRYLKWRCFADKGVASPTGTTSSGWKWDARINLGICGQGACPFPTTPLRIPLAQLLSHNPAAMVLHFLNDTHLAADKHVSLLRSILHLPHAAHVRTRLLSVEGAALLSQVALGCYHIEDTRIARLTTENSHNSEPTLATCAVFEMKTALQGHDGELSARQFHALQIIATLNELDMSFMLRHPCLILVLRVLWSQLSFRLRKDKTATAHQKGSSESDYEVVPLEGPAYLRDHLFRKHEQMKLLVEIMLTYCHVKRDCGCVPFELVTALMIPSLVDLTFLAKYYTEYLAITRSSSDRSCILVVYTRLLLDQCVSSEWKTLALKHIVTPIVAMRALQPEPLSTCVLTLFMRSALSTSYGSSVYGEDLRMELLRLTTVLIERHGQHLVEHRKDLIKFAWNHLKSEDSPCRYWAYVNVCRFIATYETPPKIILQVYVALLRTFQPEAKDLVRLALDVLIPVLPSRLPLPDFVKAIKWTKKIMYEEGHALPQLIHMWQLIIRHPSVFFDYRSHFVPQMVNSLNRLGLPPNCPIENRQLAVNLADLVIAWEMEAPQHDHKDRSGPCEGGESTCRGSSAPKRFRSEMYCDDADVNPALKGIPFTVTASHGSVGEADFNLSSPMIEMLANFLVRLALFASDNKEPTVQHLAKQCTALLRVALTAWPNAHIKFSYFEKLLSASGPTAQIPLGSNVSQPIAPPYKLVINVCPSVLSTCLDVLVATLDSGPKPNSFLADNVLKVQHLILPCLDTWNLEIQCKLCRLLHLSVTYYPPVQTLSGSHMFGFYARLNIRLDENLRNLMRQAAFSHESSMGFRKGSKRAPSEAGANDLEIALGSKRCENTETAPHLKMVLSTLSYLEVICCQRNRYLAQHSHSLMELAIALAVKHVAPHSCSMLCGAHHTQSAVGVCATPVLSVLAHVVGNVNRSRDQCGRSDVEGDLGVTAFQKCLALAAIAVHRNGLNYLRRPLVALTLVSLERATSISLLMSTCLLVGEWMVESSSLLTRHERDALLLAMSDMDRLPEIESQPLVSRFLMVSRDAQRGRFNSRVREHSSSNVMELQQDLHCSVPLRPYAVGMIALHPCVRSEYISRFLHADKCSLSCARATLTRIVEADWSPIGNRFWLVVAVEVLLDSIDQEQPMSLQTQAGLAVRPELLSPLGYYVESHAHIKPMTSVAPWYCRSTGCLVAPLKELVHGHLRLAQNVLRQLCSSVLDRYGEGCLISALTRQLSAEYHRDVHVSLLLPGGGAMTSPMSRTSVLAMGGSKKWSFSRESYCLGDCPVASFNAGSVFNVPRVLFMIARTCNINLALAPNTLNVLMRTNSFLHELVEDLEFTYERIQERNVCSVDASAASTMVRSHILVEVLRRLGVYDVQMHVVESIVTDDTSRRAIPLLCYGWTADAQELLCQSIRKHAVQSCLGNDVKPMEMSLCEHMWTECSRDLCQWGVVDAVFRLKPAVETQPCSPPLSPHALEAAWKVQDWDRLRHLLSITDGKDSYEPHLLLYKIRQAIIDRRFTDVEALCSHCIQSVLRYWSDIPPVNAGDLRHDCLLHIVHQLIEIHESGNLLEGAYELQTSKAYPDPRALASTWRRRLPASHRSVAQWDDIMRWRQFCLEALCSSCSDVDDTVSSRSMEEYLDEIRWVQVTLARVARKHGVCAGILDEWPSAPQLLDNKHFTLFREKLLGYMPSENEHKGRASMHSSVVDGIRFIDSLNFELFGSEQRAELHRLKGIFHGAIGDNSSAHDALSHSTTLRTRCGRAWLDWGTLCDSESIRMFEICALARSAQCDADELSSRDACSADSTKHVMFAQYAVVCYLSAAAFGCRKGIVGGIVRVLWLMQLHDPVMHVFQNYAANVPSWVWLPWMQHILLFTARDIANSRLRAMAKSYPNFLFYMIRSYVRGDEIVETRSKVCTSLRTRASACTSTLDCNASDRECRTTTLPAIVLKEVRSMHPTLAAALEMICIDMLSLRTEVYDRLCSVFAELIGKCLDSPDFMCGRMPTYVASRMIRARTLILSKRTSGIPNTLSSINDHLALDFSSNAARRRHGKLTLGQVSEDHSSQPCSLRRCVRLLAQWFRVVSQLQKPPWETDPRDTSKLSSLPRAEVYSRVEIPGQYCDEFSEPRPDLHYHIARRGHQTFIKRCGGVVQRQLYYQSIEGQVHPHVLMEQAPRRSASNLNATKFFSVVNYVLARSALTQRRQLRVVPQEVIIVGQNLVLRKGLVSATNLKDVHPSANSTEQVLRARCLVVDALMECWDHSTPLPLASAVHVARTAAYKNATSTIRSCFYHRIHACLDDFQSLWMFRSSFTTQHATYSIMDHLVEIGSTHPENIHLWPRLQLYHPTNHEWTVHPQTLQVVHGEPPFRLTRSVAMLCGPMMVHSVLLRTMGSILLAVRRDMQEPSGGLVVSSLCLVLRSELCNPSFDWIATSLWGGVQSSNTSKTSQVPLCTLNSACSELLSKVAHLSPHHDSSQAHYADAALRSLLRSAGDELLQSRMRPMWHPWV